MSGHESIPKDVHRIQYIQYFTLHNVLATAAGMWNQYKCLSIVMVIHKINYACAIQSMYVKKVI